MNKSIKNFLIISMVMMPITSWGVGTYWKIAGSGFHCGMPKSANPAEMCGYCDWDYESLTATTGRCGDEASGYPIYLEMRMCASGIFDHQSHQCIEEDKDKGEDCPSAGNPVALLSGYKTQHDIDYLSSSNGGLSFERYYISDENYSIHNILRHNYAVRLDVDSSLLTVTAYRENYKMFVYSGSLEDGYTADADVAVRLDPVLDAGENLLGWTLFLKDGTLESYDINGKITKKQYKDVRWINYEYDVAVVDGGDGNPVTLDFVESNTGSKLRFTYYERGRYDLGDRLETVTTDDSQIYHYSYSKYGKLTAVRYPDDTPADNTDNPVKEYYYDSPVSNQFLTSIKFKNAAGAVSNLSTWTYDNDGRAVTSEHGEEGSGINKTTIDYTYVDDATDPRITVTNALGKNAIYHYNTINNVKKVTKISGEATASCLADFTNFTYYPSGWTETKTRKSETDGGGEVTRYTYWDDGLEKNRIEAEGTAEERTFYTEWDDVTKLKTLERLNGIVETSYQYYPNNRIQKRTVKDLTMYTFPYATQNRIRTWNYAYTYWDPGTDTQLKSTAVDGPLPSNSDTEVTSYTNQGYLDTITNALGHVSDVTDYYSGGRIKAMVDHNGIETRYSYSSRGWLATVTVENGDNDAVTAYEYDHFGKITDVISPNGAHLYYSYDVAHRLYKVTDGDGNYIEYTLDNAGNRITTIIKDSSDTLVSTHTKVFDELSRLRQIVKANSQTEVYEYDVNDSLTAVTDGKLQKATSVYDSFNRLVGQTDPDSFGIGITYDAQGNITTVTDQRGLVTTYQYDGLSNLMLKDSPDTGVTAYTYDEVGNRLSSTDARGVVANYGYDAINRLTSISYPVNPVENISYSYDNIFNGNYGVGRLTGMTGQSGSVDYIYDNRGNVINRNYDIESASYSLSYAYDLTNNLTQIIYPSGRLVNIRRDVQGRVNGLTTQVNTGSVIETVISNVSYLPFGPMTNYTYGNGLVHTLGYDQDYRLVDNQVLGAGAVLDLDYGYDANNNIAAITDTVNGDNSQSFQYDKVDRLAQANGSYGQMDYQYDGGGNRTQKTMLSESITTTEIYTYSSASNYLDKVDIDDGAAQTQQSFQYNTNGNLIQDTKPNGTVDILSYNNANRYVELTRNNTSRALYSYNVLGQRVVKVAADNSAIVDHYHYDESGRLIAVTTNTGIPKREIIYLEDTQVAALIDDNYATEWDGFDSGSDSDSDQDGIPDINDNCPNAANPNQTDNDSDGIGNVCDPLEYIAVSIAVEDGWVRESGENSNVGGAKNNTGKGNKALRIGDHKNNRQYKAILSFDLSAIPANSRLISANLKLTRANSSIVGDVSSFGVASVDFKAGAFNDNSVLEKQDFQAPATQVGVAAITDGKSAKAVFTGVGLASMQAAKDGGESKVQLRLYYSQDDNNNSSNDYLGYFPGDNGTAAKRPMFVIDYALAD